MVDTQIIFFNFEISFKSAPELNELSLKPLKTTLDLLNIFFGIITLVTHQAFLYLKHCFYLDFKF